jgi:hypothetical protein
MPLDATIIDSTSPDFPAALRKGALLGSCSRIWAIGNIDILGTWLLGFFCSTKCPGNVIVHTYDLARALRDASVPVIGGFHSPMERECLDLLLRGTQPIVICPARGIERMRLPATWHTPLSEARLRVISPFAGQYRRPRGTLADIYARCRRKCTCNTAGCYWALCEQIGSAPRAPFCSLAPCTWHSLYLTKAAS